MTQQALSQQQRAEIAALVDAAERRLKREFEQRISVLEKRLLGAAEESARAVARQEVKNAGPSPQQALVLKQQQGQLDILMNAVPKLENKLRYIRSQDQSSVEEEQTAYHLEVMGIPSAGSRGGSYSSSGQRPMLEGTKKQPAAGGFAFAYGDHDC